MTAEDFAILKAAQGKEEAKRELAQEMKNEMALFREKEGAERVVLVNHMMKQSTKAMDNAFSIGRAAQLSSSSPAAASGLLLHQHDTDEELSFVPNPGLAALTLASGLSPSIASSPGKGGFKGKGKGKPMTCARRQFLHQGRV